MNEAKDILQQFGEQLVKDFKERVPRVSGKTQDSIRMELTAHKLTVFGALQLGALEYGRRPSGSGSGGVLLQQIKEWIKLKGLDLNAYAVTKNIHKYGSTLYRMQHGGPVRYSANPVGLQDVVNDVRLNALKDSLFDAFSVSIKSEIIKHLKP